MTKKMSETELRQIPLTAMFAAFGIILPQFFHLIGLGSTFLPMFLPIALGSMLLSWHFALSLAIICPLVSWLLTGMPPIVPPILPIVLVELSIIAVTISYVHVYMKRPVWVALLSGIVIDRFILFLIVSIIAPLFGFTHPIFSYAMVLSGAPGIILQFITIPLAMRFIKQRFPEYIFTKEKK